MGDTMTIDEARRRLARLESAGLSGERELAPLRSLIAVYGQLERARLELACERGEDGPWSETVRVYSSNQRRIIGPAGMVWAIIGQDNWWTYDIHGDPVRWGASGDCVSLLDGIEQACDALGIPTTWPRCKAWERA